MSETLSLIAEDAPPPASAPGAIVPVLVPYPVGRAYSYAVPAGMALAPGDYVTVPLGGREVPGVVWDAPPEENIPAKKLKTVVWKHDFPPMPEVQRKFIDWTAHYNMAPLGFVLKMTLSVPGALEPPKPVAGFRLRPEYAALLTPSPRWGEGEISARERFLRNLSPQRRKVVVAMADGVARRAAEIAELAGCTAAVVKGLEKIGVFERADLRSGAPCRNPDPDRAGPVLSEAQRAAADQLVAGVAARRFRATLVDGVTGAGKTEVYFEAIAAALKEGRQVLLLLPEIALSNAFLERFRQRFGCAPAMWHSSISAAQRKNTWRGVAEGQCKVVVGARSALFLPFADLGLIIVDEEHDPAYKQEDGVIYNARDMAVVRAHLGRIPIALISATPSLETMFNVWNGRYDLIELPSRHGAAELPEIVLVDLRADKPGRQNFIAPTLRAALVENLEKGEQSLLFLNRRGYAPLTLCRSCGQKMDCPRCTAWLVEHRGRGRLECHHCGYFMPFPKACPSCHDTGSLAPCGPGVERIVEEVKTFLPEARTVVLASDTAGTHDELRQLLADIRAHKYDIIVGTQIIAKGHHFPRLTCVGVVDADLGLKGGDLRAAERTFQILHQVSGRAGREHLPGRVYLQTWMPDNKVMQALYGQQRDLFLQIEAMERQEAHMPPYARLAGIIVSGKDERLVLETAQLLGRTAPQCAEIKTLGPAEAPFYRLRGNYRRRLLVRADKNVDLQKALEGWMAEVKVPSAVRVYIDIDPQSFL